MLNDEHLKKLLISHTPLIDVRAPIEFAAGSIPHSVNLPIMNDDERRQIGICYKENGQAAAIALGHELVSGTNKDQKINAWADYLKQHPEAEVFCFRGGLRSQISCEWIRQSGFQKTPLSGGYKRLRRLLLNHLNESPFPDIYRLAGFTGSGKTSLLSTISESIDLEKYASHKGSAFGSNGVQPSQVTFENNVSLELMKAKAFIILEDESMTIGKLTVPRRLFKAMREAPMFLLTLDTDQRIRNIFEEYVLNHDEDFFVSGVQQISKKLGGKITSQISDLMRKGFNDQKILENHREWISLLLEHYYDPIYQKDYLRNQKQIIFKGTAAEVSDYIQSLRKKSIPVDAF